MEEQTTGQILVDDCAATDRAYMFDTGDNGAFHLQGGVVTRLTYDHIESMDLDSFLKVEVPRLSRQSKDLAVIRNSAAGSFTFILGDRVLVYRTTDAVECTQEELVKRLQKEDEIESEFVPDIQYPLISRVCSKDKIIVVVSMPSTRVVYNNPDLKGLGALEMWLPPIWFRVAMTKAHAVLGAGVAAVPVAGPKMRETRIYGMRLGNMWPESGLICLGSSKVNVPLGSDPTEGEVVASTFYRVFGSNFVNHIIDPLNAEREAANEAYEKVSADVKARFDPLITSSHRTSGTCTLLQFLAVLSKPNGWMNYEWKCNEINPVKFSRDRGY